MVADRYRIWLWRDGLWAISTENFAYPRSRRKPFFIGRSVAACMNCPQLELRRDKLRRNRFRYGRS